jgi:glutathione-regulated potassium-efflux system protein KefB
VSIIDTDNEMIRVAGYMGFKVYFGDGTRLDILRAAGAAEARAVLVCVDDQEAATRVVRLIKAEFPQATVLARAFDRAHAIALLRAGADQHVRETFDGAMGLAGRALLELGEAPESVEEVLEEVRGRDADRFAAQAVGDITSGRELLLSNLPEAERDAARAAPRPRAADEEPGARAPAGAPIATSG